MEVRSPSSICPTWTARDVVGYATLKNGRGIGLDGTGTTKAAPFLVLSKVLRMSTRQKRSEYKPPGR